MTQARAGLRSTLRDSSLAAVTAGFIAALTGYTSSMVLMFQAGQNAGLSSSQITSWLWALSIGMALCTIGLSLRYRAPIVIAWSTPGAALLITSLPTVSYAEAIGAFIICATLLTVVGISGAFGRLMAYLPSSLAAALLAGILFRIASEIFLAAQTSTGLVLGMFFSFLIGKRYWPSYSVMFSLGVGALVTAAQGLLDFSQLHWQVSIPVWTTPQFSFNAAISIGIPLFVVAMASQNIPGLAVLRGDGYQLPPSPLITSTGAASLLLAPFGSHGINLAAISAAICTGAQAHPDPNKRYTAAIWCGVFYAIAGVFAATLAALFSVLPSALILSIAALALLGSIGNGLAQAMQNTAERDAALITFMITASGMSLLGIGSAFWGLVGGALSLLILKKKPA